MMKLKVSYDFVINRFPIFGPDLEFDCTKYQLPWHNANSDSKIYEYVKKIYWELDLQCRRQFDSSAISMGGDLGG